MTVSTANSTQMNSRYFFLLVPMKSLMSGSYMAKTMKECPLGLPKSVGQNHSMILMLELNQKGRDSWKACFSTIMKQMPIMMQLRWTRVLMRCLTHIHCTAMILYMAIGCPSREKTFSRKSKKPLLFYCMFEIILMPNRKSPSRRQQFRMTPTMKTTEATINPISFPFSLSSGFMIQLQFQQKIITIQLHSRTQRKCPAPSLLSMS